MAKKRSPTQEDVFRQDILAHPDEDAPRLVFADWLDEHGNPERADFIRVQCALARIGENDPERWALEARANALLRRNESVWRKEVPAWAQRGAVFERGFIARVSCNTQPFFDKADALFRRAPVSGAELTSAILGQLLRHTSFPHLARLRHLALGQLAFLGDQGMQFLARSADLCNLARLDLLVGRAAPVGLKELLDAPHLSRLTSLALFGVGPAEVGLVARWSRLTSLRALVLSGSLGRPEDIWALVGCPAVGGLASLSLHGCELSPDGASALALSPHLAGLTALDLSGCVIGAEGVAALAESPHLANLTTLNLTNTLLRAGARALACSSHLTRLTRLDLPNSGVDAAGTRALAESPNFSRLACLDLGNRVFGSGPRRNFVDETALAASPHLANLAALRLSKGHFKGDAQGLFDGHHLTNLRPLDLSFVPIGPGAAQALAAAPQLVRLATLNLRGGNIGDAGARALAESPHLRNLVRLNLVNNGIGADGARALANTTQLTNLLELDLCHSMVFGDERKNDIPDTVRAELLARFGSGLFLSPL